MSSLTPFQRGSRAPQQGDTAASTQDIEFGGSSLAWDDLTPESKTPQDLRGDPIAQDVDTPSSLAKTIQGRAHQMRTGWKAFLDGVIVVTEVRPLAPQPDGRLRPVGQWFHLSAEAYNVVSSPRRTTGQVPAGLAGPDGRPAASAGDNVPPRHRNAAQTMTYLPPVVRKGIIERTPKPTLWLGSIVQWGGDCPERQAINMLRLSDGVGVAVHADRSITALVDPAAARAALSGVAWNLTQITYDFLPLTTNQGAASKAANTSPNTNTNAKCLGDKR